MKALIKFLAVIALVLAVFGEHTAARADGTRVFKFKGKSAVAIFSSDLSECSYSDVYVLGTEELFQNPPHAKTASSGVFVFISQYDACTNTELLVAEGTASLEEAGFQINRKLDSATLQATIPVYDHVSGTSFDVFVDLTWTGVGPLGHQNSTSHFHSADCSINNRSNNSFRSSEASGIVSSVSTNFTPAPAFSASLSYAQTGDVVVGCDLL